MRSPIAWCEASRPRDCSTRWRVMPRCRPPRRVRARNIKGKGPVPMGEFEFEIDMKKQENVGGNSGESGKVTFKPNDKSPDAKSIRLTQIVKTLDLGKTPAADYHSTGGEADRNLVQTNDRSEAYTPANASRRSRFVVCATYVESRLAEDLDVTMMANVAALSPAHFARAFTATAGMTPFQYVITRRLARAHEQLERTGRSALDIALGVGFKTASHFTARFRREFSVTPREIRRDSRRPDEHLDLEHLDPAHRSLRSNSAHGIDVRLNTLVRTPGTSRRTRSSRRWPAAWRHRRQTPRTAKPGPAVHPDRCDLAVAGLEAKPRDTRVAGHHSIRASNASAMP